MPFDTKHFDTIDTLREALTLDDPPVPHILPRETEFEMMHGPKGGLKIIPSHDGRRFLYRGQNRRWKPSVATVWRSGQPSPDSQLNWILSRVRTAEFESLLSQHPMIAFALENSIEIDYDALAQHYGIPTFWLDITSSIDIACFFAVARFDRDGNITPSDEGTGVLYRVHWRSFDEPQRYFTSITHSPASRPGRQHGWSIGLQRRTDVNAQEFVEAFEFTHDRACSERIVTRLAPHLFPRDSITDVARTLIAAPAVTMAGIRSALVRDRCPHEKIDSMCNVWGERLCNGLNLDVYLDEEFALTEAQLDAGKIDADLARTTFFTEVSFRLVRRRKPDQPL